MNESDPRLSKVALAGLLSGITSVVSVFGAYHSAHAPALATRPAYDEMIVFLFLLSPWVAIALSVVAGIILHRSSGRLKGQRLVWLALAGGLFGVVGLLLIGPHLAYQVDARSRLCAESVKRIITAKEAWAKASSPTNLQTISWADLEVYLPEGKPNCLDGGEYVINPIGIDPACSFDRHREYWEWDKQHSPQPTSAGDVATRAAPEK